VDELKQQHPLAARLPGEPPDGVADIHTHPTLPRTARVGVSLQF
jgi:hypothetical protein